MPLINCKVEFSLKLHANFRLSIAGRPATCAITNAKFYVPVVTLKIKDNKKIIKTIKQRI